METRLQTPAIINQDQDKTVDKRDLCHRTDQFIRVQVQWQPASGRTVILGPI